MQDQNGNVVTGHNGFYIMGEYCYYVDAKGYICTGFGCERRMKQQEKLMSILHLANPQTVLRQVHTMHQKMEIHRKKAWEISRRADWVKDNTVWRYLDENGRAVDTKRKAGWQNIQKTWYALKTDGTVDESL